MTLSVSFFATFPNTSYARMMSDNAKRCVTSRCGWSRDQRIQAMHYWHAQSAWAQPRQGGEYGLRVYMDVTFQPRPFGP
jgi:hypothetical protein